MANIFDLFKQISSDNSSSARGQMEYIVVGLGNPGDRYSRTRHNAGFLAIDRIAEKSGVKIDRVKYKALTAEAMIGGKRVLLMKPQTFMNNSGEAVWEAAKFYKLEPSRVIVLSDDISLDVGRLRVRAKGSAGGHNGLKSINEWLVSEEYPRVKMGVGAKPRPDYDLADWVLSLFTDDEYNKLTASFDTVYEGVELIIKGDFDGAVRVCNSYR